jgi:hypothetical protein
MNISKDYKAFNHPYRPSDRSVGRSHSGDLIPRKIGEGDRLNDEAHRYCKHIQCPLDQKLCTLVQPFLSLKENKTILRIEHPIVPMYSAA